jgi:hypothetical protein
MFALFSESDGVEAVVATSKPTAGLGPRRCLQGTGIPCRQIALPWKEARRGAESFKRDDR